MNERDKATLNYILTELRKNYDVEYTINKFGTYKEIGFYFTFKNNYYAICLPLQNINKKGVLEYLFKEIEVIHKK